MGFDMYILNKHTIPSIGFCRCCEIRLWTVRQTIWNPRHVTGYFLWHVTSTGYVHLHYKDSPSNWVNHWAKRINILVANSYFQCWYLLMVTISTFITTWPINNYPMPYVPLKSGLLLTRCFFHCCSVHWHLVSEVLHSVNVSPLMLFLLLAASF